MKAIFIAAGKGSRLGTLTNDLPKPLVDVNGKSIIERQINLLYKKNINDIVIVTGYKKEKFTFKNIEYVFNSNFLTDEQAGSLMRAREKFSGDILIMFGDILFDEQILEQVLNVNDYIANCENYQEEIDYIDNIIGNPENWYNRKNNGINYFLGIHKLVLLKKEVIPLLREAGYGNIIFGNMFIFSESTGQCGITPNGDTLEKRVGNCLDDCQSQPGCPQMKCVAYCQSLRCKGGATKCSSTQPSNCSYCDTEWWNK